MGGETYTQREDFFFSYVLPGTRGANARTSMQARQRRPDRLRVRHSTPILCTLFKTDRVVLITWSPSSYTPVVPECPDHAAVFKTKCDSLPKHTGSLGTNQKYLSSSIDWLVRCIMTHDCDMTRGILQAGIETWLTLCKSCILPIVIGNLSVSKEI